RGDARAGRRPAQPGTVEGSRAAQVQEPDGDAAQKNAAGERVLEGHPQQRSREGVEYRRHECAGTVDGSDEDRKEEEMAHRRSRAAAAAAVYLVSFRSFSIWSSCSRNERRARIRSCWY